MHISQSASQEWTQGEIEDRSSHQMVSMVATYTHGNSLMTPDRPEKLAEGQDMVTLTRALKM